MLRNSDYIIKNNIKADGKNTTLDFLKKSQVGVDLSVNKIYSFSNAGMVVKEKSYIPDYKEIKPISIVNDKIGWNLLPGTYICEFNEGVSLGSDDTGIIITRSSLNRSGVTIVSGVFDPGYNTIMGEDINPMGARIIVNNPYGFYLEKDARVAQLIVLENEDAELYNGQFQHQAPTDKSNLVKE